MPIGQPTITPIQEKISDIAENKPLALVESEVLEPACVTQFVQLTDLNGKSYEGEFILRIPTVEDTRKIEIMKVRLADGVPLDSLDSNAATFFTALATCYVMFAANSKGIDDIDTAPGWWHAMSTNELPPQLIWALYDALRDHAHKYFRPDSKTGASTTGRCMVQLTKRGVGN